MKKLLFFLALLLIIPVVSAASCPCTPIEYEFKITNTYPSPETFSFESTVQNGQVVFSPSQITLASGKSKTIHASLLTPCSVHGNYTFNFKVNAEQAEKTKILPAKAEILSCYDFSISAKQIGNVLESQTVAYETCVDEEYQIPLRISNNAEFTNKFDLEIEGKYASLEHDTLLLGSDTGALVNISFNPGKGGNYSLFFEAESQLGDVEKKIRLPVTVKDCYSLKITAPSKFWVGEEDIPILLENQGSEEVNALLSVDSELVSLDKTALVIENSEVVNLVIESSEHVGVEKVNLKISLDNGEVLSKDMKLVFGNPWVYSYLWYFVGALIIIILIVLFIVLSSFGKTQKIVESIKRKAGIKQTKQTVSNQTKIAKTPKAPKPENKSYKCIISLIVLIIILALIFSLPIPTVAPNLADENVTFGSLPELKWNNNRLLRVDLSDINASNTKLLTNDKVFVRSLGKVAYLAANSNWTGSDFIDLVKDNSTENVLFDLDSENLKGFFPHGVNVYKTLGIYVYDSVRTPIGLSILILVVLLIAILLVIFLPSKDVGKDESKGKGKSKIKKADHRLTRIVVK